MKTITRIGTPVLTLFVLACASGPTDCDSRDCFVEQIRSCNAATYTTVRDAGAEGRYEILGAADARCRVEFRYTANPNPELLDQPMRFAIFSGDQLQEAVADCLSGGSGEYGCEGPLVERAGALVTDAGAPLPCGVPAMDTEHEPLYPLPRDGSWGFVDRDADWMIEPRWTRAQGFSEGRAIVSDQGAWGIIDRDGEYVLDPSLYPQSSSTVDGVRIGFSPIEPFSEGCAAAVADVASEPPFFIDRDGGLHWRTGPPAPLADYDVREYGSFSEGVAWFRAMDGLENLHGWIDAGGEIVIEPEFVGAGDFVSGLAPAATERDAWAFVDETGEIGFPGKWTLGSAEAFSEERALVDVGTYDWAFASPDGIVFEQVRLGGDRGTADISEAGSFHDARAPVLADLPDGDRLVYVDPAGDVVFAPDDLSLEVCNADGLPEFHEGLVRLVVADDGQDCGAGAHDAGLATYEAAHYVYLDADGEVVLQEGNP